MIKACTDSPPLKKTTHNHKNEWQCKHRGRDHMVVGFTTTYAISACRHCEFDSRSGNGVLDTTLCEQVCQWVVAGGWFSLGTPVVSTKKTDRHGITEILLKVALDAITIVRFTHGNL